MANQAHHSRSDAQMLESISALVDGEASELEVRRILNATEKDDSLRETWSRYQHISTLMREEAGAVPSIDLSGAIREAIDEEDASVAPVQEASNVVPMKPRWVQNLSRLGIAASVAAVMVLSAQVLNFKQSEQDGEGEVASVVEPEHNLTSEEKLLQSAPAPSAPLGFGAPALGGRTVSATSGPLNGQANGNVQIVPSIEVQMYLQQIMAEQAAKEAAANQKNLLPYAQIEE